MFRAREKKKKLRFFTGRENTPSHTFSAKVLWRWLVEPMLLLLLLVQAGMLMVVQCRRLVVLPVCEAVLVGIN